MAAPVATIRDGEGSIKLRDPVRSGIFDAITLGIYGMFWFGFVNHELAALGRARAASELGTDPSRSSLAMFPGILLLFIPAGVAFHRFRGRVRAAQRLAGIEPAAMSVGSSILLFVLFPIGIHREQTELNRVWAAETVSA